MIPEFVTRVLIPGTLTAAAIVILAPRVLPIVAAGARPLAKDLIKVGLMIGDKAYEAFSELEREWGELSAEAREELAAAGPKASRTQAAALESRVKQTAKSEAESAVTGFLLGRR